LSEIVGVCLVLQHTPRAVIVTPPSEVMLPPLFAVVSVISVTAKVVNTGLPASSFLQLLAKVKNATITNKVKIKLFLFFFS
jgi:hypothetical protein